MNITYKQCLDKDHAIVTAAERISFFLQEESHFPILVLVSGGSALDVLAHIKKDTLGPQITLNVIDERFGVAKEHHNFYQLSQTTFARNFIAAGGQLCDTHVTDAQDVEEAGLRLEKCIQDFLTHHPTGKIVTLLGIGDDGHTVGVMPYERTTADFFNKTFVETTALAAGYDAQERNAFPLRATVTLSFLRDYVDYAVVYAVGEKKRPALTAVMAEEGELYETPARIIRVMKDVHIVTDCQ